MNEPVKTPPWPPVDPNYVRPADDELNQCNWGWNDFAWYLAVRDADKTNDFTRPMTMLLDCAPPLARELITELLSRKQPLQLQNLPGGPHRSPYAELTDEQTALLTAALEYQYKGKDESHDDAVNRLVIAYCRKPDENYDDANNRLVLTDSYERRQVNNFVRGAGNGLTELRKKLGLLR